MGMGVPQIATATAALAWMFAEWIVKGKPSILGICSGAVAGLVAITPASGFVDPRGALIIGIAAGVLCYWGVTGLKNALGYDDSLDAFGVHGVGGTVGAILTGVLAVAAINTPPAYTAAGKTGLLEGGSAIGNQLIATGITWVIAAIGSFILLKITAVVCGLRVTA